MHKRKTALAAAAGSVLIGSLALPAAAQPVAAPPRGPLAERAAAADGGPPGSVSRPAPARQAPASMPLPAPAPDAADRSVPGTGEPSEDSRVGSAPAVDAEALRAAVSTCHRISRGAYRTDRGAPADVPVCGRDGVVHWNADLDIDCDGIRTAHCHPGSDPYFQPTTAFTQSDGRYLNSEELPFVVVPAPGPRWNYWASGIRGGTVAAVVHRDRVVYGVVGDTGPADTIGEASYAAAEALGIDPHPLRGGAASGVTYILFPGTRAEPIENRAAATALGEALARELVAGTLGADTPS
ncbi:glycoside hydrolase family 75 protein [Streptomyces sp. NPDC006984]|uniref:glycoside hydrolase family 75 protein n=1 Tax=Streptomyces sp. NPDC006984 TaxID=3155463 RepID=UPI0033D3998E